MAGRASLGSPVSLPHASLCGQWGALFAGGAASDQGSASSPSGSEDVSCDWVHSDGARGMFKAPDKG